MARRRAFNAGGELVSKTIDSVANGVSQQPPTLRLASQCEAQDNLLSKASDGAVLRPPTEHIDILHTDTLPDEGYKMHVRSRDENIEHLVMLENGDIRVFNLATGLEAVVSGKAMDFFVSVLDGTDTDQTTEAAEATADDMDLMPSAEDTSYAGFGMSVPWSEIQVNVTTAGTGTYTVLWEYWNGITGWTELTTINDGTDAFKTVGQNTITFDRPSDWTPRLSGIETGYWAIRCRYISGTIDINPLGGQAWLTAKTYLDITGSSAAEAFAITSVADYSFVVNKETVVAASGVTTDPRTNEFMIYIVETTNPKNTAWAHELGVTDFLDETFNHGSADGGVQPGVTRTSLIAQIYDQDGTSNRSLNFPNWKFLELGTTSVHGYQALPTTSDPNIYNDYLGTPSWGTSDEVYTFVAEQVQKFSDLPPVAPDLFTTEVTGSDGNEDNNYWVIYKDVEKAWVETVQPELDNTFNNSTMPHVLVQTSTGGGPGGADEFTFLPQDWAGREKGDLDSAPAPSFVGKAITDVFFHKDRLGFVAEESVILSETGEFFNFWPTTVTAVIDSDPIDAASTNNRVAFIDYAVPFNEKLYLFSSQGSVQNALTQGGADALTVKSAQVVEVSAFATSPKVKPVPAGKNIYYSVDKGSTSSVHEYFIGESGPDAEDTTIHVPTYLPANITNLTVSASENVMIVHSADQPNKLYPYSFLFLKQDKVQQAWSSWTFDDSYIIKYVEWVGDDLYLVVKRGDGLHLEKMNLSTLTDGDLTHRVHLDSLVELTGSYSEATNLTTWSLPYHCDFDNYGTFQAILSGTDFGSNLGKVVALTDPPSSNDHLCAEGDWSADSVHIGRLYTHTYEFTKPIITAPTEDGRSRAAMTQGRLQIGRFKVLVMTSAGFEARVLNDEVNPDEVLQEVEEYVYEFPSKYIGQSTVSPAHPVATSTHRFDVAMESTYARIQITGTSHLPFTLVGAEWEGTYTVRASRV
jgi:hypothetical protein